MRARGLAQITPLEFVTGGRVGLAAGTDPSFGKSPHIHCPNFDELERTSYTDIGAKGRAIIGLAARYLAKLHRNGAALQLCCSASPAEGFAVNESAHCDRCGGFVVLHKDGCSIRHHHERLEIEFNGLEIPGCLMGQAAGRGREDSTDT
jgi:hypothetical protein